ncbi:MAG: hypothetical protein IJP96_12415 [Synergistaceae bacterium]|nr:hypothetical protein [Synergistaceae bacterium]
MKHRKTQKRIFETARAINIVNTAQQLLTRDYELYQAGNEWRCKSISDYFYNFITNFLTKKNCPFIMGRTTLINNGGIVYYEIQ